MAASYSDMNFLANDGTFQLRVASALWQTCVAIATEVITTATLPQHIARKAYVVQILNNPNFYKPFFVNVCSVDANCISDATQAGTVILTSGNVAAQAALVTDAHVASAVSSAFNAFVTGI